MIKRLSILGVLILLLGCSPSAQLSKQRFAGTVEITEYVLGPKVPGRVASINIQEGDKVTQGQVLATFDRYEQAKKDLTRAKALSEVGGVSPQVLENAQLALDDQQILSPVNGVVLVKAAQTGEVLAAGAGALVIGDMQDQWIKVFVTEGFVNQLSLNQKAVIYFDGVKQQYQGHVTFIATKAEFTPRNVQTPEERVTQAFGVKVKFDDPNLTIRPGTSADVQFYE